ncbi:Chaperone J-domain-containing protein [Glarea lozoyensis ATCC 20868]|uniref:Chaperone J-domain-containing protein n=2 Tax=Glarea lozoyensis TaxID=101852 RepID=S3DSW0_GLAL2|nr:Chaperone J-domain-containing protein [Glarea lozoyensis ATCC 20868]EPE29523.1 Chaperone J-domain-containing protein [Glarea lozoyensis ATCC 20868]
MSNAFLSLAGWTFLPNLVTGWLQSLYYGITIRAGEPKPQPNSPKYALHGRRIHILVVATYLLYTIYEADWEIRQSSDFYQDLGVLPTASERDIKSRFRRLAAMHHPDKVSSQNPSAEGYFVHLKLAQDTLLNPTKRFAYERFGPSMLEWQRCSSMRDYIIQGLQSILPYYGVAAVFMYLLGLLGYLEWGKYWRWLTLFSLCVFELTVISRPHFPIMASKAINPLLTTFAKHPPYLPFQLISLARKLSITLYIAFSQIGPLLQPPTISTMTPEAAMAAQLQRLEATAQAADTEATRLMTMEMSPFAGDPGALNDVKGKVKEWLVQNTIRNDPEVRDAIGNLLQKRRVDAPAGARGNR